MTELLALGITVGASNAVAVATAGEVADVDAGPVSGGAVTAHPSALRLSREAAPAFAGSSRGRHSDDVVLEGFLPRVGDPVDILAEDGSAHAAQDLVATAIGCLIDEVSAATGARPGAVVACHPAWWSLHTVEVQRAALEAAGLGEVTLVPEPAAAARWLEAAQGPLGEGAIVVLDLGATGATASVVRTGAHTAVLASLRSTEIGGDEFDLLTMRYVLANALGGADFDPFDPVTERRLAILRESCREAKESLSRNTATVVPVALDGPQDQVRLVRDELEDLLRGPLLSCLDLIRDAVHRAGIDLHDVGRVLLTGGGGAIPLVAELVSTEFGLPVPAAPEPAHTSARGAAALAADLLASEVDTVPAAIAEADTPTEEFSVVDRAAATGLAADAPVLPRADKPRRLSGRQRGAVIGSAVAVLALLATGTLAYTTMPTGTDSPASTQQSTTVAGTGGAAPAGSGGTGAANVPAADPGAATPGGSNPVPGQPGSSPTGGVPAPGTAAANGAPTAGAPAPGDTAVQPQPGQPAPAPAPAP
ncbi:Hsp70 family protein, partial [Nocardia farcinica]